MIVLLPCVHPEEEAAAAAAPPAGAASACRRGRTWLRLVQEAEGLDHRGEGGKAQREEEREPHDVPVC